jgi:hypothetical protein
LSRKFWFIILKYQNLYNKIFHLKKNFFALSFGKIFLNKKEPQGPLILIILL